MDRVIKFEYNGRPFEAYCPAAAVFDIYEKFGQTGDILGTTRCMENDREGWDNCCWLLAELARWGELLRRQRGEDPRPMLTVSEVQLAPPADMARLREVVLECISAGFRRDIPKDEEEEVDLVLARLEESEKKAPPAGSLARLISRRRRGASTCSRKTP